MFIKKWFFALVGSLVFLMLSGCGGGVKEVTFACVYPDAPNSEAPAWVCDEPVEGVVVSAVGTAAKSAAGHSFMKNMASTDARVQLAQSMKVHVTNMVKQYAETTGAADSETVDRVNTSVTKQITDETLVGTKVFKSQVSPNGMLYVLLGADAASAAQATANAVNSSLKNENALWQQFKSKAGQDELAEAIANQK